MRDASYWVLMALAGGRRHGYALIEEVDRLSSGRAALKVATLYPALDRLAAEGLIEADGEDVVSGRRRRYFRLSARGAAALEAEATRLADEAGRTVERLRAHGWNGTTAIGGTA